MACKHLVIAREAVAQFEEDRRRPLVAEALRQGFHDNWERVICARLALKIQAQQGKSNEA